MDSLQRIEDVFQQGELLTCIELCQRELLSLRRSFNPQRWAQLHAMLAQCYLSFCQNGETGELPAVVHHCELALQIFTRRAHPEDWASCHYKLGLAFCLNPKGDRPSHIESAITHFQEALQVWNQQDHPEKWADLMLGLAKAFKERTQGNRPENLQLARQHYTQALKVWEADQHPERWAQVQFELADLFCKSDLETGGRNIERAIEHYQQALSYISSEDSALQWAQIQHGLGVCFSKRTQSDRGENLEQSISHFKLALEVVDQENYPEQWANIVCGLGGAFQHRIRGNRPDNLSQAIHLYQLALQVFSRETSAEDWTRVQIDLGNAHLEFVGPQRAQYIERAIVYYHSVLEVITREKHAELWAQVHFHLGDAYRHRRWRDLSRYWQGDVGIEQRIEQRRDNIEHAIRHYRSALLVFNRTASPNEWAMVQDSLGQAYLERIRGNLTENVEQAILYLDRALLVRSQARTPELWATTQLNLGIAYEKRTIESPASPAENKRQAAYYYQQALKVFGADRFPTKARKALHNLAGLYFERGQWQRALNAYEQVESITIDPESVAYADQVHKFGVDYAAGHPNAAYCLLKLGRPAKAFERLEQGRSRLLSQALRPQSATLGNEIVELSNPLAVQGSILIAPLVTSQGGAIFVIQGEPNAIEMDHVVFVENLDDETIDELMEDWLRIYIALRQAESKVEDWRPAIERITGELWQLFIEPILALVKRQPEVRHLTLIPQDRLRLLPLHAAWRWDDQSERRYLLDDYAVSFAPAVHILNQCQQQLQDSERGDRLVVGVEHYQGLPSLKLAGTESQLVADIMGTAALMDRQARKESVLQALAGKELLHFACRGAYGEFGNPLNSYLRVGEDQMLSLEELVASPALQGARLVVLSACETGIANLTPGPNEYFGLPAGFMLLGAAGVLSSLWVVNDLSTVLLIERFYHNHLQLNQGPAQALQEAQFWLRNVSRTELVDYLKTKAWFTASSAAATLFEVRLEQLEEKPYANPFYWATFLFSGASS